jgi:alpha,alpha-trehalase
MIQIKGDIFKAVQSTAVFPDSKTFVDSVPNKNEDEILKDFHEKSTSPEFDLKKFVSENFTIAEPVANSADKIDNTSMETYIESLWEILKREPDKEIENDSRIPLPYPYIVPGGRFREIFYWDTYFTDVGLDTINRHDIIESMLKNFIYLQSKIGHIPNGNRWYFATRSQPPVLGLIIDLLYQKFGIEHIKQYIPALETEQEIWSTGQKGVQMPDGLILSRYWDKGDYPREEAYKEDTALAAGMTEEEAKKLYRNLRTGAESGWDYSARWLKDPQRLETIQATDIIPIDLNALVYGIEILLAKYHKELGNNEKAKYYQMIAEKRKEAVNKYCWNEELGYYFDYNLETKKQCEVYSMAAAVPLFVNMATEKQANKTEKVLKEKMLKPGGFIATLNETNLQWDNPNGWAPSQWFAVKGLLNYDKKELATEAMKRWIKTMRDHFAAAKMLMEKYNVVNPEVKAGGGEYSVQEGFGWTNGIALKFLQLLGS